MMSRRGNPSGHRAGFTLVEAVMSILIVGVMFVAALSVLANSRAGQRTIADRGTGTLLAGQLMVEILQQAYVEPNDSALFGLEINESAGSRAAWDDVDDYDGWSASPPQDKTGVALTGLDGWERRVEVAFVDPADLATPNGTGTGVKRIVVIVLHDGRQVARLSGLRTGARDKSRPVLDDSTVAVQ